jgi:ribonuclease Z
MSFEITVLGSSSALPTSTKFPSAHVVNIHERFFLIDCGEGTQIQLRKYKIKFSKINRIFITHLHGDHFYGIFGLISSFSLIGRVNDLHIYSPGNLEKIVYSVIKKKDIPFSVFFHTLKTDTKTTIYETKSMKIYAFPLIHRIETYGFLFEEKQKERNIIKAKIEEFDLSVKDILNIKAGNDHTDSKGNIISNKTLSTAPYKTRSYAYCSDTAYSENTAKYVHDVDFLYHEATFTEDLKETAEETKHSTAKEAALIAKQSKAGTLLIGHFSTRYKTFDDHSEQAKKIFPNTIAVNEGDSFIIPQVKDFE